MTLLLGLLVIGAAVYAVMRRIDARLVLLLAAFALGVLGGKPQSVLQKLLATLVSEQFVVPICCAMGFAYVLRHTECDQHLVHLLVDPLRKARPLLIPGAVLTGFIVNVPIISQASATMAVGPVLIPLMRAAGISPITAGASLLLGASLGGELLNPGAPEFRTVVREAGMVGHTITGAACVQAALPLDLLHLAVATGVFWFLSVRFEAVLAGRPQKGDPEEALPNRVSFKVNLVKAAVPMVPLVLLFVVSPPFQLVHVPAGWLVAPTDASKLLERAAAALHDPSMRAAAPDPFDSRLIGAAMLVGAVVAALTVPKATPGSAAAFFEGTGYAFGRIISVIAVATCFGEGVKLIGVDRVIGSVIRTYPALLMPSAGVLPLGFAAISGSGMAATQSLFGFFAPPAVALGVLPQQVGAVVSLAAAAGRTMSPVAAVCLMCASLTNTEPADLARRVAVPLLSGIALVIATSMAARALHPRTEFPNSMRTGPSLPDRRSYMRLQNSNYRPILRSGL